MLLAPLNPFAHPLYLGQQRDLALEPDDLGQRVPLPQLVQESSIGHAVAPDDIDSDGRLAVHEGRQGRLANSRRAADEDSHIRQLGLRALDLDDARIRGTDFRK